MPAYKHTCKMTLCSKPSVSVSTVLLSTICLNLSQSFPKHWLLCIFAKTRSNQPCFNSGTRWSWFLWSEAVKTSRMPHSHTCDLGSSRESSKKMDAAIHPQTLTTHLKQHERTWALSAASGLEPQSKNSSFLSSVTSEKVGQVKVLQSDFRLEEMPPAPDD